MRIKPNLNIFIHKFGSKCQRQCTSWFNRQRGFRLLWKEMEISPGSNTWMDILRLTIILAISIEHT